MAAEISRGGSSTLDVWSGFDDARVILSTLDIQYGLDLMMLRDRCLCGWYNLKTVLLSR